MVRKFPGRPFLLDSQIKQYQARFPFWPPRDASPVIPIEPWGKQFFVYNGIRNVEVRGDARAPDWGSARPRWWQEDIALSLQLPGEDPNEIFSSPKTEELEEASSQTSTHLCVTDFRKRPLIYLSIDELKTVRDNLKSIQLEMDKFATKVGENTAGNLEKLNYQLDDNKYMHIRRGRVMNPPSRSGRGVMASPNRPVKRKPKV